MISEDSVGIIELGNVRTKFIIVKNSNNNIFEILASSTNYTDGIHNGTITNPEKASKVIRACISEAEKQADVVIKKVNVVLEQPEFLCTKLSKNRKINGSKVQKEDIDFLLSEGKKQVNLNDRKQSIIHIFNHNYIVDGKTFIEEPINIYADYLSHEMTFVTMPKNNIKNINQTFIDCDIEVERFISSIFSSAIELLNQEDLYKGAVLLDLGFEKTSLGLFKNLALVNSLTLPIGVNHLVKDISKICSLSLEESKNIIKKFNFSIHDNNNFFDKENNLKKDFFASSKFRRISKSLILKIIKTRIDEILELIKKQLLLDGFKPNIGQNFFLIGGGSNLMNIDKYFSNFFQTEIRKVEEYNKHGNEVNSSENFSSCLGAFKLIKNGWETEAIPESMGAFSQKLGFFGRIFSIIK